MKVFVGLRETAGYFRNLTRGFDELGVAARLYDLSANPLGYGGQQRMSAAGRMLRLRDAPPRTWRSILWRIAFRLNRILRAIRAGALFPYAVMRYDAFILAGDTTFLGGLDLRILRWLKRPVVIVFFGSDHRPPYLSGLAIAQSARGGVDLARDTRRVRRRVAQSERYASAVVALPASAQLHSVPFLNFLAVGIPFGPLRHGTGVDGEGKPSPAMTDVRVLHAPTRPQFKGTHLIRQAIADLREQGLQIEYRELTGRPHREVLEALRWADFVVDEIYSDTPMAGFAAEAAYFGKPAVVGSYYRDRLRVEVPSNYVPPSMLCAPVDVPRAIERLVTDTVFRRELGTAAQRWVTDVWNPAAVARRYVRIFEGTIERDWVVDPASLRYSRGWGISESDLRSALRNYVQQHGSDALMISGNPQLRAEILRLAGP